MCCMGKKGSPQPLRGANSCERVARVPEADPQPPVPRPCAAPEGRRCPDPAVWAEGGACGPDKTQAQLFFPSRFFLFVCLFLLLYLFIHLLLYFFALISFLCFLIAFETLY